MNQILFIIFFNILPKLWTANIYNLNTYKKINVLFSSMGLKCDVMEKIKMIMSTILTIYLPFFSRYEKIKMIMMIMSAIPTIYLPNFSRYIFRIDLYYLPVNIFFWKWNCINAFVILTFCIFYDVNVNSKVISKVRPSIFCK